MNPAWNDQATNPHGRRCERFRLRKWKCRTAQWCDGQWECLQGDHWSIQTLHYYLRPKTLNVHLPICTWLHTYQSSPNYCTESYTHFAQHVHTYTHSLWNDARSRRWIWRSIQRDPICSLWYPRAQPSKPLSWIWEKLLQAFEASIWGLGKFVLLIWAI